MTDQEIVDEYARSLILLRHQGKRFPNTPKEVYEAAERIGKDQNSCMEELIEQALDALTTAYLYKLDPSKGTDLTIRIERTKSTRDVTCTIELARPGEKVVLHITKAVVQRLKESIVLLTQIPLPSNPPEYCPTIQYRFEDKESGVVVMWRFPRSQVMLTENPDSRLGMGRT